jgi:hypothetical protein
MPDYGAIKTEIALSKYSAMTDDQIAASLETTIVFTIDVSVSQVEGYLRSHMLMSGIESFVSTPPNGAPPQLVEGLRELLGLMSSPHVQMVVMTDPTVNYAVTSILGGAVSVGLMSGQNESDLMAMSSSTTTRAAQLGLDSNHVIVNEMVAARLWDGS